MNSKILEVVSQNNVMLLEKVRDMEEGCQKQLKEKEEQIKRLQNLLGNKDDQMKKITSRIEAGSEFDQKVKKFFLAKTRTFTRREGRRCQKGEQGADGQAGREQVPADGEPPGGGRHKQDQGGSHGPHLHHRGHSKQNRTGEGILMSLIPLLVSTMRRIL